MGQLCRDQVDGDQGFRFRQRELQLAKAMLRVSGIGRDEQDEGRTVDDGGGQLVDCAAFVLDRKSTRLNSSHH